QPLSTDSSIVRSRLPAGEGRIRTPGAMRVSSLPKAGRNWLCLWRTRLLSNKRRGLSLCVRPEPDGCGARLKCAAWGDKAARQTPAAGPGKAENDWLPAGERGMCVSCPEKGGARHATASLHRTRASRPGDGGAYQPQRQSAERG